jgi:hypothetical protein
MSELLEVIKIPGYVAAPIVSSLYEEEGHGIEIRQSDLFFVGLIRGELAASVRFCIEEDRRGIGG